MRHQREITTRVACWQQSRFLETLSLIIMTFVLLQHDTHISHNRIDLKHMDAPYKPCTTPSQTVGNFAKSLHGNANPPLPSNIKQDDKAKLIDRRISVSKTNSSNVTSNRYMMQSGCVSKPTQRHISQM